MPERHDVAIVGTGPGGLSAAITLKIRNKSILLLGSGEGSEKVGRAHEIRNYLGLPSVSGEELSRRFFEHLRQMEVEVTEDFVTAVYAMGDYFALQTRSNASYEADSVILATGVAFEKPYPGEEEYLGRGVSYCATCDAPLYKGKRVAVVGTSPEAEAEAEFLSEVASEVIYVPTYEGEPSVGSRVRVVRGTPSAIEGERTAGRLVLDGQALDVDGIFIFRESVAPAQLVPGIELGGGHVTVNRSMETSIKGCFACGDITGTPYQYIKAAGEGNVAALSAVAYLDKKRRGEG